MLQTRAPFFLGEHKSGTGMTLVVLVETILRHLEPIGLLLNCESLEVDETLHQVHHLGVPPGHNMQKLAYHTVARDRIAMDGEVQLVNCVGIFPEEEGWSNIVANKYFPQ